jgi:hypothetical protein
VRIAPVAVGEVPATALSFEAWDELDGVLEGVDSEAGDDDELDGGGDWGGVGRGEGEVVVTAV